MKSETQPEQPTSSDEAVKPETGAVKSTARRITSRSLLAAIVIGIITISLLWTFVKRQEGHLVNNSSVMAPEPQALQVSVAKESPVARKAAGYTAIEHQLASNSERIEQWVQAQQNDSALVMRELLSMAETVQAIKAGVVDLEKSNQEQTRYISEITAGLDTIAMDVRALKTVNPTPKVKHKPRPVKSPPFNIDAIDVWDGMIYIAVSQSGRVAFLKAGEQQSGWTVTHIDHMKGRVDFQGPANQVYTASVPR